MIQMPNQFSKRDGVLISESTFKNYREFEKAYLKIRKDEARVMSDEIVRNLPQIPSNHPDYDHWNIRRYNIKRFLTFLDGRKNLRILDVGCGNGFLSHLLSQ